MTASIRALGALFAVTVVGCLPSVPSAPLGVRACLAPGANAASAPSRGALRVLPSSVAGVAIDSASWHTAASTEDLGANEFLSFRSTLRSERPVARGELAIVYEIDGQPPLISADFLVLSGDGNIASLSDTTVVLKPGVEATYIRSLRVRTGFRITGPSAVSFCPNGAVRLMSRNDLALYLEHRRARDDARPQPRAGDSTTTPLIVLADTTVDVGGFTSLITGVVLNTADTTVHDVVVAAIVDVMVAGQRDTIEYRQSEIPAHASAGFSGTSLHPPERILRWTSYPASAVSRPIAGAADQYRASYVRRRLSPRPKTRWPYIDAADDVGRRHCMADEPPLASDPWKRFAGPGFTICVPATWTDSASTLRGPGGSITLERVAPSAPNDRLPESDVARYNISSADGWTIVIGRKGSTITTRATWSNQKGVRIFGVAADSATAALEINMYKTARFDSPPK